MSTLTQALVDVGFNVRRAEAIEAALLGAVIDTDQLADGAVTTAKIEDGAVTNAKLADMAQATIKGRASGAGTGDPQDLSQSQVISVITGTQADAMSVSGNRWGAITAVADDGVMEVGRIIDFHNSDDDTDDNDGRLRSDDIAGQLTWTSSVAGSARKMFHDQDFTAPATGLVLLNSGTVNNAAKLDIVLTGFTGYRAVKLLLSGFTPASDANLDMQFSTNGGSSFDATGYGYSHMGIFGNGASGSAGSASGNEIRVAGNANGSVESTASNGGADVEITLFGRLSSGRFTRAIITSAFVGSGGQACIMTGQGQRETAQDTDAVQVYFPSVNIASGDWALYGYA